MTGKLGQELEMKVQFEYIKMSGGIPSVRVLELWADSIFLAYSSSSTIKIKPITISNDFRRKPWQSLNIYHFSKIPKRMLSAYTQIMY